MSNTNKAYTQGRFDEPLDVEDVPEFHVTRLLILLYIYRRQTNRSLSGRMKLAKLDFFVRYPVFLQTALRTLRKEGKTSLSFDAGLEGVEASMVRYRFGPWDHKYYDLISLLTSRGLMRIGARPVDQYQLTDTGTSVAESLMAQSAFEPIINRCMIVVDTFSGYSGTELKDFVYATFADEVTARPQGSMI